MRFLANALAAMSLDKSSSPPNQETRAPASRRSVPNVRVRSFRGARILTASGDRRACVGRLRGVTDPLPPRPRFSWLGLLIAAAITAISLVLCAWMIHRLVLRARSRPADPRALRARWGLTQTRRCPNDLAAPPMTARLATPRWNCVLRIADRSAYRSARSGCSSFSIRRRRRCRATWPRAHSQGAAWTA